MPLGNGFAVDTALDSLPDGVGILRVNLCGDSVLGDDGDFLRGLKVFVLAVCGALLKSFSFMVSKYSLPTIFRRLGGALNFAPPMVGGPAKCPFGACGPFMMLPRVGARVGASCWDDLLLGDCGWPRLGNCLLGHCVLLLDHCSSVVSDGVLLHVLPLLGPWQCCRQSHSTWRWACCRHSSG